MRTNSSHPHIHTTLQKSDSVDHPTATGQLLRTHSSQSAVSLFSPHVHRLQEDPGFCHISHSPQIVSRHSLLLYSVRSRFRSSTMAQALPIFLKTRSNKLTLCQRCSTLSLESYRTNFPDILAVISDTSW